MQRFILAIITTILCVAAFVAPALADEPYVGEIRLWTGSTPPQGWVLLDSTPAGTRLNRLNHPILYSIIGCTYGCYDAYDFYIPNMYGKTVIGTSDNFVLAATGGEITHTLTITEIPAHTHGILASSASGTTDWSLRQNGSSTNYTQSRSTGDGVAFNKMPPYLVLHWMMYVGETLAPTETPTATPMDTPTPLATYTPAPTYTPEPTYTPNATYTPVPPAPTYTPEPTYTPVIITGTITNTIYMTGSTYLPAVYSSYTYTLTSGNTAEVPLEISAGQIIVVSTMMLLLAALATAQVLQR